MPDLGSNTADLHALLVGFAAVLIPGWLVALAWGARRTTAVVAGPAVSVSVAAITALATNRLPMPVRPTTLTWVFFAVAVLGLTVGAARLGGTHLLARRRGAPHPVLPVRPDLRTVGSAVVETLVPMIGLAATTVGATVVLVRATGNMLDLPMQSWDTAAHINSIEAMTRTGIADPWRVFAPLFGIKESSFYPDAFHVLASQVQQLTGVDAVTASNLGAILVAGLLWPAAATLLTRAVLGRGFLVTVGALATSGAFWNLPWSQLGWGVLWPTAMAGALAPTVVTGVVAFFGLTAQNRAPRRAGARLRREWPRPSVLTRVAAVAGTIVAATATGLAHPRILVLLVPPVLVLACWGVLRSLWRDRWFLAAATVLVTGASLWLAYQVALAVPSRIGKSKFVTIGWPYTESIRAVLRDQLTGSPDGSPTFRALAVLVVLGALVVVARRRGLAWLPVAWVMVIAVDAVTAAGRSEPFVSITSAFTHPEQIPHVSDIIGWWYGDRHRSTALIPVFAVPLVAAVVDGVGWSVLAVVQRVARGRVRVQPILVTAARAIITATIAVGSVMLLVPRSIDIATSTLTFRYATQANDPTRGWLSPAEIGFLKRVGQAVGTTDVVLNNPADGSALLYAYTGTHTAFYINFPGASVPGGVALRNGLVTSPDRAGVCRQLEKANIHWVLNMGPTMQDDAIAPSPAPGMQIPDDFWATQLVLHEGDRRLYKIVGCPPASSPSG